MYAMILFAYIINIIVASIVHYAALSSSNHKKLDIYRVKILTLPSIQEDKTSIFLMFVKYFISIDYWSASSFKKNIVNHNHNELGEFIKKSNNYNHIFSSFLVLYYIIVVPTDTLFRYFLFLRVISRSFEIMIAFYDDVIDDTKKSSSLKPNDRMKLAVRSYFEVIILNTLTYAMLKNKNVSESVFTSIGVSTFTSVEFCNRIRIDILLYNSFIALQLFTSLCLVSFALARYIGEK